MTPGCIQKGEDNVTVEYFNEADLLAYGTDENNAESPEEQLEIQLREFYEFSKKFFSVWNDHIEKTSHILEKFNNKNTTLDNKIIYSRILFEKYEEFNFNLEQLTPPPEASKAYQYALNAVSRRILFFEEFGKGTSMYKLIEIENAAYLYETLFWEEINRLYDYFDEMLDKLGIQREGEFYFSI